MFGNWSRCKSLVRASAYQPSCSSSGHLHSWHNNPLAQLQSLNWFPPQFFTSSNGWIIFQQLPGNHHGRPFFKIARRTDLRFRYGRELRSCCVAGPSPPLIFAPFWFISPTSAYNLVIATLSTCWNILKPTVFRMVRLFKFGQEVHLFRKLTLI